MSKEQNAALEAELRAKVGAIEAGNESLRLVRDEYKRLADEYRAKWIELQARAQLAAPAGVPKQVGGGCVGCPSTCLRCIPVGQQASTSDVVQVPRPLLLVLASEGLSENQSDRYVDAVMDARALLNGGRV